MQTLTRMDIGNHWGLLTYDCNEWKCELNVTNIYVVKISSNLRTRFCTFAFTSKFSKAFLNVHTGKRIIPLPYVHYACKCLNQYPLDYVSRTLYEESTPRDVYLIEESGFLGEWAKSQSFRPIWMVQFNMLISVKNVDTWIIIYGLTHKVWCQSE